MAEFAEVAAAVSERYTVLREIGRGATAVVYLARDLRHDRQVAIKAIRRDVTAAIAAERFLREIAIAAQLNHPHILPLLDSGEANGIVYYVMPYVEGDTLRARLATAGHLSPAETTRILSEVADALSYAHSRGVIHRDIKPDNVMLLGRHALVADFGIAKALNVAGNQSLTSGFAIGTPAYMAPEQAVGQSDVGAQADTYALGIMGYEMLTGRPPFGGPASSPQEILTAHVVMTPETLTTRAPNVPPDLAAAIMRCLAKDPKDRWPSADALASALDQLVAASPASTPTPSGFQPVPAARRWAPWLVTGIATVGVILAVWDRVTREEPGPEPALEKLTIVGNVLEAQASPDGTMIAYVAADSAGQQLWLQDQTGTRPLPLVTAEVITGLTWIRGGSELSFSQRNGLESQLVATPRFGGAPRILSQGMGLASPDGTRLAMFGAASRQVVVITQAGADTAKLARDSTFTWITGVAWSPRSDRLLLAVSEPIRNETALELVPLAGPPRILYRDAKQATSPAFSPDGETVYFFLNNDLNELALAATSRPKRVTGPLPVGFLEARSPFIAPLGSSIDGSLTTVLAQVSANVVRATIGRPFTPTALTTGTAQFVTARFSNDGATIATARAVNDAVTIGMISADTGGFAPIASAENAYDIAWSPDGRELAVTHENPAARVAFYSLATGTTRRVPSTNVGAGLSWAANAIVAQSGTNRGLVRLDANHEPHQLRSVDSTVYGHYPRITPDGRWVAYSESRSSRPRLFLASLVDSTRRELAAIPLRPLRWNAAGTLLFAGSLVNLGASTLYGVPLAGDPKVLMTIPPGYQAVDVSPDGSTVLLIQTNRQSDAWRITLGR